MKHILIDTDAGVDDALAIIFALASPELAVEGITTVGGNIPVEPATRNVFTILDTLFPAVYPLVAEGAAAPLGRELETAAHVHGADGLGNISELRLADGSPKYPRTMHDLMDMTAADFIIEEAYRHGRNLTIIALGPLTNIAEAIRTSPTAMKGVGEIIIMGGAFRVYGNTSPVAEFNMYVDPEAAETVIGFDVPKTIVPLDVTEQVILLRSELEARFAANPSPVLEFARDVSGFYMDFHAHSDGFDGCYMHDPTTIALAINPSLARTVPAEVHVERQGEFTRGMTVADLRPERANRYHPNAQVCVEIDAKACLDLFFSKIAKSSQ
ncbi:MAG: nucleoside hydrolase [Armatimonadota bacterium]|nr:nucleoside hydrolase [Armatimonadota bacterium]